MKCSKCGKEIINIQKASCISGYDEKGKHENWLCEKCSSELDKEHPCYPIDYVKKSITNFICKKCGSTEYEIKDKPNGTGIAHGLYCAKCGFWHKWLGKEELRQYDKKDSKDTIIARLQAENAALKERLVKAVELPVKVGDIVYCVDDEDGDYIVKPTVVTKKNIYLLCSRIKGNPSDAFLLQKAAEEWCKELKGEKK